jgi:hypothetical protein
MFISYKQLPITKQVIHKYTTIVLILLPYTKIKIYGKTYGVNSKIHAWTNWLLDKIESYILW